MMASANANNLANVRYEWFQSQSHVTVGVLVKNLNSHARSDDTPSIHLHLDQLSLQFICPLPAPAPSDACYTLSLQLAHPIDPTQSTHEVLSTRVEIRLKKLDDGLQWSTLERVDANATPMANVYPSSSKTGPKNWDKIDKEVAADESDKPEGEAALNALFQQIYSNASEETRRAMIKSYTESNGTTLSTNWDEVGKGKVETRPPEGMAAKSVCFSLLTHQYSIH